MADTSKPGSWLRGLFVFGAVNVGGALIAFCIDGFANPWPVIFGVLGVACMAIAGTLKCWSIRRPAAVLHR